jgi:3D (Asp-Asp-Asp) domain-containing protein
MKSLFSGSAILATALLSAFLLFSAKPSLAETVLFQVQQEPRQVPIPRISDSSAALPVADSETVTPPETLSGKVIEPSNNAELPIAPPVLYVATAYSLRGKTASGRHVSPGIIAADPRVLPLGSRVRLEAGAWSGEYVVADTGGSIRGRKIDIWTPSTREAMRFGRRHVKLTVLSYGGKRSAKRRG